MVLLVDSRERRGWPLRRAVRHFSVRGALLMLVERAAQAPFALLAGVTGAAPLTPVLVLVNHCWILNCLGMIMVFLGSMLMPPVVLLRRCGPMGRIAAYVLVAAVVAGNFVLSGLAISAEQDGDNDPATSATWPGLDAEPQDAWQVALRYLFYPGAISKRSFAACVYNVVPWLGIAAFGMVVGFVQSDCSRLGLRRFVGAMGGTFLAAFFVVRIWGGAFGNFIGWPRGTGSDVPFIAFFTICKYPPSLAYALVTVGGDLGLLYVLGTTGATRCVERAVAAQAEGAAEQRHSCLGLLVRVLLTFGHVPFFFFLLHQLGVLVLIIVVGLPTGGVSLAMLLLCWLVLLAGMYPACRRYNAFKSSTAENSLWRLF